MFKFRKIASVLASTLMVSSTIALAAAANFPAPFVSNGSANVAIVYGNAQVGGTDLLAAADISNALQAQLATQTATSSGSSTPTTVSGGDFVKLEKSSTKFNLGKGILDVVSGTYSGTDLGVLLADGSYLDKNNDEFKYTQKVILANNTVALFDDNDYKSDTPTIGMRVASGNNVLNYTVDFSTQPSWANLATTNLKLMGKNYYILSADNSTQTLTLLDSAYSTVLQEGKSTTISAGGKSYDVSLSFISDNKVKLSVNGELTNSLSEAQTYKLKDGSYVGVKSIDVQNYQGGAKQVEFSIGSGKLKIVNGSEVEMNDNSISRLTATTTSNTATAKLSRITLSWNADNDQFAAPGSEIIMPGFGALKLSFGDMTYPSKENVAVEAGSDTYAVLKNFPLKSGTEDIPFLYGNSNGNFSGIGKDATKRLITSNTSAIIFDTDTDEQFVASWTDGRDAESYLMRATSFKTESSGAINKTTFQYKSDGSWTDARKDAQSGDSFTLGNAQFTVGQIDYTNKAVNLTGTSGTNFNTLYTKTGLKVFLPIVGTRLDGSIGAIYFANSSDNASSGGFGVTGHNNVSYTLTFAEEDRNGNKGSGDVFNATIGWNSATSPQVTISAVSGVDSGFYQQQSSKVYEGHTYSALATQALWDKNGDQYTLALEYHGDESYANVFLTNPQANVSGSDSGSGVTTLGNPIIKDSEVASAATKNLIVVGGSCVNTVAAQLLGSQTPLCGADFTAKTGIASGQFLIQTFDRTGGKVATLVAGYNAQDTTNAATYLKTNTVDTTVGKKYLGTSATSATLQATTA